MMRVQEMWETDQEIPNIEHQPPTVGVGVVRIHSIDLKRWVHINKFARNKARVNGRGWSEGEETGKKGRILSDRWDKTLPFVQLNNPLSLQMEKGGAWEKDMEIIDDTDEEEVCLRRQLNWATEQAFTNIVLQCSNLGGSDSERWIQAIKGE